MLNTVRFMEEYIKLEIIKEFGSKMILMENKHLTPLNDNKSILSMCSVEDNEDIRKFALTQVRYLNEVDRTIEIYNLMGIISILNDGRIIVTEYDMQ